MDAVTPTEAEFEIFMKDKTIVTDRLLQKLKK